MTYEQTVRTLGDNTARIVMGLWEQHKQGMFSLDDFIEIASKVIAAANGQSITVAQLALHGFMEAATGAPAAVLPAVAAVPAGHAVKLERLALALATVAAADDPVRLERLARVEPLEQAARAFSDAIAAHPDVTGWQRGLETAACELCQWWARDGQVWPDTQPMPTHKGCVCTPIPVVETR